MLQGLRTNLCRVVGCAEDELRGSVVARTDVRDVGLIFDEYLGTSEIAELEDTTVGVEKQVLRLDISVADALAVDVGERAEQLVNVQLDLENRHGRLHLIKVAGRAVDGFGNKFEYEIEVDLVLLKPALVPGLSDQRMETYAIAVGVVESLQLDNVRVSHYPHNLELSVLRRVSQQARRSGYRGLATLKRLSWSTRLMAASSPLGDSLVWKTTPKEPLPTILHWVYCISFVSPVKPSWTFSRITSVRRQHVQSVEMGQWMESKDWRAVWRMRKWLKGMK